MKALFDGQDYMLILDKEADEAKKLRQGQLGANLTGRWDDNDLGKKLILEFGETTQPDGISLEYIPKNKDWGAIERIRIMVNERALQKVEARGWFGTRYGAGDKIEIYNDELHSI